MRVAPTVDLSAEHREVLEQRSRARSLPARVVERARIVLLAAAGKQDKEIAEELGISVQKAARGVSVSEAGVSGIGERSASTRPPSAHSGADRRARDSDDHAGEVGQRDTLVHAQHGSSGPTQRIHREAHLAQAWLEATSGGNFQS